MEQQTPIPPKLRMKSREGQKRAIFPSLIWEGVGSRLACVADTLNLLYRDYTNGLDEYVGRLQRRLGLGFPFILSKIVACERQTVLLLAE